MSAQTFDRLTPFQTANTAEIESYFCQDASPSVSALFAGLVGITATYRAVPPITIQQMLDDLFGAVDRAALDLGVERIRTIGDCYMAGCDVPYAIPAYAAQSLRILNALQLLNQHNGIQLRMRVGAHGGAVVAGVIGSRKFIYDLWGIP